MKLLSRVPIKWFCEGRTSGSRVVDDDKSLIGSYCLPRDCYHEHNADERSDVEGSGG